MIISTVSQRTPARRVYLRWTTPLLGLAASVAALGITLTPAAAQSADARPIHHTVRVKVSTHHVDRPVVKGIAKYVHRSGRRMVRWEMTNGSVWLSPSKACLGPRHRSCLIAWDSAAKWAAVGGTTPATDGAGQ